jgi:arginyl-tRNA synthetase
VQSIFRKAEIDIARLRNSEIIIEDDLVRSVVLDILRFNDALNDVLIDYQPNALTSYLFELTQRFFTFYDKKSIKDAESPALRESRALICDLVGRTIKTGLELLGIRVVERM